MKLAKKVVVVTGGGNGLGRELVRQLVARGAQVALVDIDAKGLQETIASLPHERVAIFEGSITDSAFVESLPGKVIARFGAVDGLFNNAGIMHAVARFHDMERAAIQRVLDVNLVGAIAMMHAFLPHLVARPEAHLLNVSSIGGILPMPSVSIYGATKAALKLLTEALRFELAPTNVRVSLVLPGFVKTNLLENSGVALPAAQLKQVAGRGVTAEQAAAQVLDGVEANDAQILIGTDAKLLSLLLRLAPGTIMKAVGKQLGGMLAKQS